MPYRRPRATAAARSLALVAAAVLASACGPGEGAAPTEGALVLHRHEDERFALAVTASDGATSRTVRAEIVPRGDYHLSLDYPSRLELAGQPVARREDATTRSEAKLAFDAALPEAAASARVSGRLRFGVCLGDELCEPVDHRFEALLD